MLANNLCFRFLGVIDRMLFEPMLIAHLAYALPSARSDASSQTTTLPGDTGSQPYGTTEQTER